MLLNILQNGKTVTGSAILLVVLVLQKAGIDTTVTEITAIVGAFVTLVGWIHKGIKHLKA